MIIRQWERNTRWVWLVLAVWLGLAAAAYAKTTAISGVRIGQKEQVTRFVLDADRTADFAVTTVAEPYRAIITLPPVNWQLLPGMGRIGRGVITNFNYGAADADSFRIVLNLANPVRITRAEWLPPSRDSRAHRLVLDFATIAASDFKPQRLGTITPPQNPVTALSPPAAITDKPVRAQRVIVLDAGHGGVDPGAIGVRNTYEKNITLAAAQELYATLSKNPRYRVVMTRHSDVFIPLADRRRIGQTAKADLFISLHADHHTNRQTRGTSIYTLSEKASDAESAKLAEQENKADLLGGVEVLSDNEAVSNILLDLVQQETVSHALLYANLLLESLAEQPTVMVLRNPLRSAGFVVLRSPSVPSVLVELGFLSNADDERALNSPAYRRALVAALTSAVDAYFQKLEPTPARGQARNTQP